MKISKHTTLLLVGAFFVLTFMVVIGTIFNIGGAYKERIASFINPKEPEKMTIFKKKTVKKITIKKGNDRGCMEITPDGAVRVFSVCGQTLSLASRFPNPRHILQLFKLITEEDLDSYTQKSTGAIYQLTIETDTGTQTVYLVLSESDGGVGQTIISTIQIITGDIPRPSSTLGSTLTPTPTVVSESITLAPTGSLFIPTPTPTIGVSEQTQTFTCGFNESGDKKKPFNISNIVCSTEPSPAP
ncbi:hypothetical protein HY409_02995 [Candidatus Gottesmanbacteria bacterium]|nr:hypothetical protein [Candidatus Gottesmanbacteria bacterium]